MERKSYNNDYNGYHLFRDYYASDSVLIVFTSIASFNLQKPYEEGTVRLVV